MNIQEFILKYSRPHISELEYSEILTDVQNVIINNPFPFVSLYENELIERIRNNYNGEIFISEEQVSLRKDFQNIFEFGRVNKPHQSNFYGTLADNKLDEARITTVLETNSTLRNHITSFSGRQIFTTSQWLVNGDLKLLIIPFHPKANKNSRLNKVAAFFKRNILIDFGDTSEQMFQLLFFLSDHFGKEVHNHLDYKLTAAVGEVFMEGYDLDGIIYPSIKSEFRTQNIVLRQSALNKLKLHKVGMLELFINKDQVLFDLIAYAEDLGPNNSSFRWIYVSRLPKDVIESRIGKFK